MLLDADVQAGIVVDRAGVLRGMITVDDITALMRESGAVPLNPTERAAADAAADDVVDAGAPVATTGV
jgi:Mg/Co/Ni transporter MgtE